MCNVHCLIVYGSLSLSLSLSLVLGFNEGLSGEVKPRVLLMGLRRSGKSSIQKVVFHKMSPNETLFLESTNKICREDVSSSSFVSFQIWDFPGQIDFFDPTFDYEMIFRGTGALIFVIDSQVMKERKEWNRQFTKRYRRLDFATFLFFLTIEFRVRLHSKPHLFTGKARRAHCTLYRRSPGDTRVHPCVHSSQICTTSIISQSPRIS